MSNIRSITRIEPGQLALMMGATYALLGILVAVGVFMFSSMMPMPGIGVMGRGLGVLLFPVLYAVLGYVCGFIGAHIYNLVARTVGGVKVTVTE